MDHCQNYTHIHFCFSKTRVWYLCVAPFSTPVPEPHDWPWLLLNPQNRVYLLFGYKNSLYCPGILLAKHSPFSMSLSTSFLTHFRRASSGKSPRLSSLSRGWEAVCLQSSHSHVNFFLLLSTVTILLLASLSQSGLQPQPSLIHS